MRFELLFVITLILTFGVLPLRENTVQFTFTPSPNIGVYQQAHYQCSVDHTGVSIVWFVNETGSGDNDIIQLGIVTNGAGSPNSSLVIPGYPQYNNTVVRCNAFGTVEGNTYVNVSVVTLKIQGKLSEVGYFNTQVKGHYCINCSWSPPFSLDGVPIYGYIINVTNEVDNIQYTTNVSNTTGWSYCSSQFGNYTVSVAGNNSAGEGNVTYQAVILSYIASHIKDSVSIATISNYSVTVEKEMGNWIITCTIKNSTILNKTSHVHAHLTPVNNDISPVDGQGSGQFEGDTFIGTVNMGVLPVRKKWLISFSLVYNSGLYINVSQPTVFTTFDVQNASLEVKEATGEVCFSCYFFNSSQARGCFVKYKCLKTDFNGNITILRTSIYASNAAKCLTGIHSSIYNVTFYDLDHNNTIYKDDYAVKLTHQSVTGLSSPHMTSMSSVPSSVDTISSSSVPTTSPSPCTDCYNIGTNQQHLPIIIGSVITVVLLMAMIIVGVMFGCKYISYIKNKPKHKELSIMIEPQVTVRKISIVCDEIIEERSS